MRKKSKKIKKKNKKNYRDIKKLKKPKKNKNQRKKKKIKKFRKFKIVKKNKKLQKISKLKKSDSFISKSVRFEENIKSKLKFKIGFDFFAIDRFIAKFFQAIENKIETFNLKRIITNGFTLCRVFYLMLF